MNLFLFVLITLINIFTGIAFSGDVKVARLVLRESLEPIDEEVVRVASWLNYT